MRSHVVQHAITLHPKAATAFGTITCHIPNVEDKLLLVLSPPVFHRIRMVKSSKSKWTYLYIVLAGPLAEPRGATETVGVVHYQYHIDQQPHQRCEQHNPACVGTNLASEHSRVADGHFSLHRDGED